MKLAVTILNISDSLHVADRLLLLEEGTIKKNTFRPELSVNLESAINTQRISHLFQTNAPTITILGVLYSFCKHPDKYGEI